MKGHTEVVGLLAQRDDVDVNRRQENGRTIVEKAVGRGHSIVVEILKRHGAQYETEAGSV